MTTIDLNRVRLFVRIVEGGSFTAAAAAVGLPKSSISRAVAALERDLGVRLLQRTTRRVQVTEAGRTYYESVSRALSSIDEATEAVADLTDVPRGTVRLTAPADMGDRLLAAALTRFARRYPEVHLEVALTQRVVDLVHEGFDLAVRIGKLTDSRLVARPLGPVRAGVFASPGYLKRHGKPRSVAELSSHECLLFRSAGGRSVWELVGPAGPEKVEVHGSISADDHHMISEAASGGHGLALLALFSTCGRLAGPELTRVLPHHATVAVPLHLVYPSARLLPKRVALLRDQLLEELPPLLSP